MCYSVTKKGKFTTFYKSVACYSEVLNGPMVINSAIVSRPHPQSIKINAQRGPTIIFFLVTI